MRTGTAAYVNGQETVRRILEASRQVLVESGHVNLTMRRVAKETGISLGNLNYYYPSRAELMADLLQYVIDGYLNNFSKLRNQAGDDADEQFRAVVGYVFDDLSTRETTMFFPELWVLANRDERVAQQMERLYAQYREILVDLIGFMNPRLDETRRHDLAVLICASLEGHTMFIGHGRPHRARSRRLREVLIDNFLRLVKDA